MWAMDAGVLRAALVITLSDTTNAKQRISADVMKTLTSLESEETDLLAWIGINGTFAVRSIVVSLLYGISESTLIFAEYGPSSTHFTKVTTGSSDADLQRWRLGMAQSYATAF